jgi:hypothetical protein
MFVVCAFLRLGYRQCEKENMGMEHDGADKHRGSLSKITVANPVPKFFGATIDVNTTGTMWLRQQQYRDM